MVNTEILSTTISTTLPRYIPRACVPFVEATAKVQHFNTAARLFVLLIKRKSTQEASSTSHCHRFRAFTAYFAAPFFFSKPLSQPPFHHHIPLFTCTRVHRHNPPCCRTRYIVGYEFDTLILTDKFRKRCFPSFLQQPLASQIPRIWAPTEKPSLRRGMRVIRCGYTWKTCHPTFRAESDAG